MDPKLIHMLTCYIEKTGSISMDVRSLLDRQHKYIEKQDRVKQASVSNLRKQASDTALKMSTVRLLDGETLIATPEQIKQAALLLSDHEKAISLFNTVLDAVAYDRKKQASLEPGRGYVSTKTRRELTAAEQLRADNGLSVATDY
jgi:hypothetical protein